MENLENIPFDAENTEQASPVEDTMPEPESIAVSETEEEDITPSFEAEPLPQTVGKKLWKPILAIVTVAALVITACGVTVLATNRYWLAENAQLSGALTDLQQQLGKLEDLQQQLAELEEKVASNSFTGNGNSISGTGTTEGMTPGQVYAQNYKSVVAISNQSTTNIFGQATQTASSGSGFIVSADGYIITNHHVIQGATKLTVITSDDTEYSAKVIGHDEDNDFALIKIDATDLPAVKLGSSDDLIVGDQVAAIGNPLGQLTNSLTVGYVSAKERDVTASGSVINMLQTDAAINPGNSGGPLFNMKGEVIGITSAKYSGTTSSGASIEGIGFAIPINDVISMMEELIEKGYISAPYMGVTVNQRADGIGVYIESVDKGSAAEAAGIKAGDIIVGIGEYTVTSLSELDKVMRNFEAYQTAVISVYRSRQVLELTITFAEKNQTPATT